MRGLSADQISMDSKRKPTKRTQQAINTRNRIYESALRIMELNGFDAMTIEQIATEAGVSIGAFYHHFKSKYEILNEVFNRADDYFRENVIDDLDGESTAGKIVSFFCHYADFNNQQGVDYIKALYKTQSAIFLNSDRYMVTSLRKIVSEGIEKGDIRAEGWSEEEITEFLFNSARGLIYHWCLKGGDYSLEERMNKHMGLSLKCLRS